MINGMFPFNMCPIPINTLELEKIETYVLKSKIEDLEKEHYKMMYDTLNKQKQIIDKALGYTKQFINGKTSRIDEWKNVELVLETIVEILGDKENE